LKFDRNENVASRGQGYIKDTNKMPTDLLTSSKRASAWKAVGGKESGKLKTAKAAFNLYPPLIRITSFQRDFTANKAYYEAEIDLSNLILDWQLQFRLGHHNTIEWNKNVGRKSH